MSEIAVQSKPEDIVFHPHPKDKRFVDMTGKTYGHLTVVGFAGRVDAKIKHRIWYAKCTCGSVKTFYASNLTGGIAKSCGCMKGSLITKRKTRHGMAGTSENKYWSTMKARYNGSRPADFKNYAGRGSMVCSRWIESFDNFLEDMGHKPSPSHSIDRINNDGNYEPGNCRWATQSRQGRNTRVNRIVVFNGEAMCMSDLADKVGVSARVISKRTKRGWSLEDACKMPLGSTNPRKWF